MIKNIDNTCMYPGCDHVGAVRGLCIFTHYGRAYRLVKTGQTTWEELIKKGKALESTHVAKRRDTKWFLK